MCGRYVLGADAADYAEYFGVDRVVDEALQTNYNVAPTDPVYAVAEWEGERLLGTMRWGFVPHWATDAKAIQINARAETIATKPMFRDSFARKRCIIPADGFYEWEPKERGRHPHWVRRGDGAPMGFAGVWSTWRDPAGGEPVRTCAIVTTAAVGIISSIHDRMPVALDPSVWDAWLDRDLTDAAAAARLIVPIPADVVVEHEVSTAVNSVRNNDPRLIEASPGNRLL